MNQNLPPIIMAIKESADWFGSVVAGMTAEGAFDYLYLAPAYLRSA